LVTAVLSGLEYLQHLRSFEVHMWKLCAYTPAPASETLSVSMRRMSLDQRAAHSRS
jgi:hypothetical protein